MPEYLCLPTSVVVYIIKEYINDIKDIITIFYKCNFISLFKCYTLDNELRRLVSIAYLKHIYKKRKKVEMERYIE